VRQPSGALAGWDVGDDVRSLKYDGPSLFFKLETRYLVSYKIDGRTPAVGGKRPRRARQTAADKISLGGTNGEVWRLIANGESG
jgi:hypothetical protein